ncbi:putative phosphoesterase [Desulfohalotomaculum tongense]|uniref:YfcE family phosphodiesterase n=1 Tax=Desulforadius tongensis TaxID=1216062 RepID=UPI00195BA114|nr:putative phosphoesterase [Desulforadius tongensis]
MKIAVFADVHSNFLALEAVLKDIRQRGINRIYCAGDLVGYGPRPNEVIKLLQKENIPTVMGNYDDAVGSMRLVCGCDYKDEKAVQLGEKSITWTKKHTSEENKAWLKKLPQRIEFTAAGLRFLIVHGSPGKLNRYLYEHTPDEYLNKLLAENRCDVLVCGHTHLPYHKTLSKGDVINVGSAGKPKHGDPSAVYAVINIENEDVTVEFIKVSYNFEQTAREIEEFGLPAEFAEIVRTGVS